MRRTTQRIGIGATLLLTACLAQAVSLVPPWCTQQDAQLAARSTDGKWILSAGQSPYSLVLLDTTLETVQRYQATSLDGTSRSPIAAVFDAPSRRSFIVALPGIAELWEISYDPKADPIYDGLVHDYRMGEGLARPGYFGVRRIQLKTPLTAVYFTQDYRTAIGISIATADLAPLNAHVINLDIRREIATIALPSLPDPEADLVVSNAGMTWRAEPGARQKMVTRAWLERYCTP